MNPSEQTVAIPATIAEATASLNGIGALLTATKWERAAIVYAFTEDQQGQRTDLGNFGGKPTKFGVREFAALGITGLAHHEQVAKYRNAWAEAIALGEAVEVQPGDSVVIPDLDFPPMSTPSQDAFIRIPKGAKAKKIASKVPVETAEKVIKELRKKLKKAQAPSVPVAPKGPYPDDLLARIEDAFLHMLQDAAEASRLVDEFKSHEDWAVSEMELAALAAEPGPEFEQVMVRYRQALADIRVNNEARV